MGKTGEICAYGFDLGPAQQEALRSGDLTGALGQQPFLQGFWPVMQLYLQIDRGIAAANLDTRAQLVTKDTVELVGKRFELSRTRSPQAGREGCPPPLCLRGPTKPIDDLENWCPLTAGRRPSSSAAGRSVSSS